MSSHFCRIALVAALAVPADAQSEIEHLADGRPVVRGELLVGLHPDAPASDAALTASGARIVRRTSVPPIVQLALPAGVDPEARLAAFASLPGVLFAERNGVGEGGGLPVDDPFLNVQWHLENTGQSGGTPGADIRATSAWELERGDPSIIVAVLDSGIDFAHPAFLGRTLPGFDTVNEDNDPTADHAHGTLVTGILAANADDGHGVAGVDHGCTVLPVKVLNQNNTGTIMDLVEGLEFARNQGAHVVSMSLINFPGAQSLRMALEESRTAGQVLVACGGNNGLGNADISWPGASEHTLSIGWTDREDDRAGSSGSGVALDFVAPGHTIATVHPSHVNDAAVFSGCSAATPVAAGVISLLLASDPTLTQDAIFELLRLSADDRVGSSADFPGRDNFYGHGRLDARAALECLVDCVGDTYCDVNPNTFSSAARLHARGSDVLADDDFTLHARFLPPTVPGLLFTGRTEIQVPFGDGLRCIGGTQQRLYPPLQSDAFGDAARTLPLAILGAQPGTTSLFQFWYRDNGPAGFNTTDALRVLWQ